VDFPLSRSITSGEIFDGSAAQHIATPILRHIIGFSETCIYIYIYWILKENVTHESDWINRWWKYHESWLFNFLTKYHCVWDWNQCFTHLFTGQTPGLHGQLTHFHQSSINSKMFVQIPYMLVWSKIPLFWPLTVITGSTSWYITL
jgi:hypothetical protein